MGSTSVGERPSEPEARPRPVSAPSSPASPGRQRFAPPAVGPPAGTNPDRRCLAFHALSKAASVTVGSHGTHAARRCPRPRRGGGRRRSGREGEGRTAPRHRSEVILIDPVAPPDLRLPELTVERRDFDEYDVDGAWLVVAMTANEAVDDEVERAARAAGALVTRADLSDGGGIAFAAVLERGPVIVGVATGGASPALSRWLRDRIAGVCLLRSASLRRCLLTSTVRWPTWAQGPAAR